MTLQRRIFTLPVIAALLSGCGVRLFAGDSEEDRQTLTGIKGVRVVIEDLEANAISDGLTVDQIRTDVELRLRKAGVNVLSSGCPVLYVHPFLFNSKTPAIEGLYAYHCEISLKQLVFVPANSVSSIQNTWSDSYLGIVGKVNLSRAVREGFADLVDKFLNAYLTVNPKK